MNGRMKIKRGAEIERISGALWLVKPHREGDNRNVELERVNEARVVLLMVLLVREEGDDGKKHREA